VAINSLSDIEQAEKTPWQELGLPANAYEAVSRAAEQYPDAVAINHVPEVDIEGKAISTSYSQLKDTITRAANLFHRLGIGQEDTVSLMMPVIPESLIAFWAAQTAGIANPVNSFLETDHLLGILNAANTKVIVFAHPTLDPDGWPRVQAVREQLGSLKALVQVGGDEPVEPGVLLWRDEIAKESGDDLQTEHVPEHEDIAAYFHTGGTTGVPKLARLTHLGQILQAASLGRLFGRRPGDARIIGAPMFHVGGPICFGLVAVMHGETILFVGSEGYRNKTLVENLWHFVERFQITELGVVPATWSALLNADIDGLDLSCMTVASTGGAPISVEIADAVSKKFDITLVEVWGMTELHGIGIGNPPEKSKIGSIGIRFPYMEFRCVELEAESRVTRECGTDEIGTLLVRGPQVFKGYVSENHNRGVWIDGDWLNTGDLARIDAEGYFWLTGRSKDVIIRAGHNIDPAMVEDALAAHDGVELAAAVGRPDPRVGEMPVAYVQLRKGFDLNEQELMQFIQSRVPERAALPKSIFVIDDMPLTAVNKIFKPALRLDAIERTLGEMFSKQFDGRAKTRVTAKTDATHGTLVTIQLCPDNKQDSITLEEEAQQMISAYPLRYKLDIQKEQES
jgi:fatty-acyl-CoA synthase